MHSNIWKIVYKNDAFIQIKTTTNFYWIGMVVAGMLSIQTADFKKKKKKIFLSRTDLCHVNNIKY